MSNFDVIVVGGGPGGYVAAIRSAQLGLSTAVVEKQHMGGICLNWGCIPTKALLAGADVAHKIATASDYGINVGGVTIDIDKLVGHSRSVSGRLSGGVSSLMSKNKITVINGEAKLADKGVLEVGGEDAGTYKAPHIILATGARPRAIPGLEPDGEAIWTYFEALVPKSVPATMLVIGSGAIGTEFASLYADLGTQVTLVEMVDKIVPAEDPEISDHLQRQFKQRGIEVHTGTTVENAARTDGGVRCELVAGDSRDAREFEKVIVAAGVVPNVEGLGLEALGAEFDRGFIKTDQWSRTNVAGLYAIGDVAGPPCLAHKASHEGIACVEGLAGVADAHPVDLSQVPGCTYSRPQIASVGMTEPQAKAAGLNVSVGRFSLRANGKALAIGEGEGLVKTIFDQDSGELLGAHMIGPEVTEQIQGFGIAQALEATDTDLAHAVFAHPTVSEAMHESVLDSRGQVIHQ